MSGAGFHVHGPHEHELEHAAQGAHDSHGPANAMINQIAMFTAVIATVGAIFSYMGGATQANAGLFKNTAGIKKTEASNQWNYFQAKIERYEKEKKEIEADARKLEAVSADWDKRSDEQMHQHHRWAQATTVLQVSIALAAIALLTRKKWLEYAMFAVAGTGVLVGVLAMLHI